MSRLYNLSHNEDHADADRTGFKSIGSNNSRNLIGIQPRPSQANKENLYVMDFTPLKYLYLDPTVAQRILGYGDEVFSESWLNYFISTWNKNDSKVYTEKIIPEALSFLKKQAVSDYPKFSFSFNYRVKANGGKYFTFLQTATYFHDPVNNNALAAASSIINITDYKCDSNIIHIAEKNVEHFSTCSRNVLFKSIYFPDKAECALSKRELEIFEAIYAGLSSKEIARKLFISINTVNNHRKNILRKTNTNNTYDMVKYAKDNGYF